MRHVCCVLVIVMVSILQAAQADTPTRAMRKLSRTLQVPAETVANSNVRVLTEGRVVEPSKVTDDVNEQTAAVVARTGSELRALNVGEVANVKPIAAYALPISYHAFVKDAGGAMRPADFAPSVFVMNAMRFRPDSRRFEVDLMVGLINSANPKDQSVLAEARKLFVSADADVTPRELQITRLGDPVAVKVSSISPVTPFKVTARTMLDEGDAIEVPVVRPALRIESARGTINGLGLEKTTINVQAEGLDDTSNMHVILNTSAGDVKPSDVVLSADGRGTAEIRSEGFGVATLTASGGPFAQATGAVNFSKPWSFAIAMVLGSIAGWLIRTRARSKSVRSFLLALASGTVVTVACSIGIRLAQWAPEATIGEALTFFVAAIGAWLGMKAIMPQAA